MGSRPNGQGEPYGPDDNGNRENDFGPPTTMSFPVFTDRLPQRASEFGITSPTALLQTTVESIATTTSQTEEEGSTRPTMDTQTADQDAGTYTTPVRLTSTTLDLSTYATSAFSTPDQSSVDSQTTQADPRPTASNGQSTLSTSRVPGSSDTPSDRPTASQAAGLAPTGADNTAFPEVAAGPSEKPMSSGEIAAAAILPILAALAIFAALLLCRRRRRKRRRDDRSPSPPFFSTMMEKMAPFRHRADSPSTVSSPPPPPLNPPAPVPTVAAARTTNRTYYTGLDTSSSSRPSGSSGEYYAPPRRSEGGTFLDDPPPAYFDAKSPPQLPEPEPVALLRGDGGDGRSPFADPVSPLSPELGDFAFDFPSPHAGGAAQGTLSPLSPSGGRQEVSRSHSFTSTQYSDTASVHSARAARRSVAGPTVVVGRGSIGSVGGVEGERDVFEDPPLSPIRSVGGGR